MKTSTIVSSCFVLLSALIFQSFSYKGIKVFQKEPSIVGTWKWSAMVNTETNENMGIEMMTMGMSKEVKTKFLEDGTYIEYKSKLEGDGFSEKEGEWKLEQDNTILNMISKGKSRPAKIIKFTKDSLVLQPRAPMALVMVKQN